MPPFVRLSGVGARCCQCDDVLPMKGYSHFNEAYWAKVMESINSYEDYRTTFTLRTDRLGLNKDVASPNPIVIQDDPPLVIYPIDIYTEPAHVNIDAQIRYLQDLVCPGVQFTRAYVPGATYDSRVNYVWHHTCFNVDSNSERYRQYSHAAEASRTNNAITATSTASNFYLQADCNGTPAGYWDCNKTTTVSLGVVPADPNYDYYTNCVRLVTFTTNDGVTAVVPFHVTSIRTFPKALAPDNTMSDFDIFPVTVHIGATTTYTAPAEAEIMDWSTACGPLIYDSMDHTVDCPRDIQTYNLDTVDLPRAVAFFQPLSSFAAFDPTSPYTSIGVPYSIGSLFSGSVYGGASGVRIPDPVYPQQECGGGFLLTNACYASVAYSNGVPCNPLVSYMNLVLRSSGTAASPSITAKTTFSQYTRAYGISLYSESSAEVVDYNPMDCTQLSEMLSDTDNTERLSTTTQLQKFHYAYHGYQMPAVVDLNFGTLALSLLDGTPTPKTLNIQLDATIRYGGYRFIDPIVPLSSAHVSVYTSIPYSLTDQEGNTTEGVLCFTHDALRWAFTPDESTKFIYAIGINAARNIQLRFYSCYALRWCVDGVIRYKVSYIGDSAEYFDSAGTWRFEKPMYSAVNNQDLSPGLPVGAYTTC